MTTKSTKHLTRRELKQEDQIHATLSRFSSLLAGRTGILIAAGAGVVLIVVGILLWQVYARSQDDKAQKLFSEALEVFHAPIGAPATGSGVSFASDADRARKALEKFQQVEQQYSSRPIAALARYYTAMCQRQLKNDKEAIRLLQGLESSSEANVRALARNTLAETYRAAGMKDQAMQTYQVMLKDSDSRFPKDAILAAMGELAESMGHTAEAAGYYQRLTREHAQSAFTGEANARLAVLAPGAPQPQPQPPQK